MYTSVLNITGLSDFA